MTLADFLQKLEREPHTVSFPETTTVIDEYYCFTPVPFTNGDLHNAAGENNGSCKIFAFAAIHGLSEQQTLHCFGDYYRKDVIGDPGGTDHRNIRQFMQTGWTGIIYENRALAARPTPGT